MTAKNVLGLDIGTNSIGAAVVRIDENGEKRLLLAPGPRIIPMPDNEIGDFANGKLVSAAAARRQARMMRRRIARFQLRQERLLRVLNVLGFLPEHFAAAIDFETRKGKFKPESGEPKLAWNAAAGTPAEAFLFEKEFEAMCAEFRAAGTLPEGRNLSRDWTLYFLRKKALTEAVSPEALAWILLSFNAKRGYNAERGDDDVEDESKKEYFLTTNVVAVEEEDTDSTGKKWFRLIFADKDSSGAPLFKKIPNLSNPEKMVGVQFNLVVTEKAGGEPSVRYVKDDDWKLRKVRNESRIGESTVGAFIYESLLRNPDGRVVREIATIGREFYRKEAEAILRKQAEFMLALRSRELFEKCVRELYPNNVAHANLRLGKKDAGVAEFLLEDVLFYQRPLKSKKSEIDVCALETCRFAPKAGEALKTYGLRCTARSNPFFAEFRIRQFIANLRVVDEDALCGDVTETIFATPDDKERLFDWLNDRESVNQKQFLKDFCGFGKKGARYGKMELDEGRVHWNYLGEGKDYPCNPVRTEIRKRFRKCGADTPELSASVVRGGKVSEETLEHALWHLLYSVVDREELRKALTKFSTLTIMLGNEETCVVPEESRAAFVEEFLKIRRLETLKFVGSGYASYSERALRKLLPLMRSGKRWSAAAIDAATRARIEAFVAGTQSFDADILLRAKENGLDLEKDKSIEKFSGLPVWLASYVVYGRHSEAASEALTKWGSPDDVSRFLEKEFRHNSLRNPVVEKVVLETLRVVRDIWKIVGSIDEIHVELGREIRQPTEKRARTTQRILENENENLRIRQTLQELADSGAAPGLRPGSPAHQEKYKLWEEGKKVSPYTGKGIPLSELFTDKYEIEHVIPKGQFFDNSLGNKVICEAEVNKAGADGQGKGNELAMSFIIRAAGGIVHGHKILDPDEYRTLVSRFYSGKKKEMLLATEIPERFTNAQLTETQYISKYVRTLLSRIVRRTDADGNALEDAAVASGVISCTGAMTDALKKDWGLNDVWNEITLPRFRKMAELAGEEYVVRDRDGKDTGTVPLAEAKGFKKKRIDHRHHAMDAIVIACCTREHVQMMSNESAGTRGSIRFGDLRRKLKERNGNGDFKKPWETFTQDVRAALEKMIPTFRKNVRAMSKGRNVYEKIDAATGERVRCVQEKGDVRKIRKPLHKETFYGRTNLQQRVGVPLKVLIVPGDVAGTLIRLRRVRDKALRKKLAELVEAGNAEKGIKAWFKAHADAFPGVKLSSVPVWTYSDEIPGGAWVAARKAIDPACNLEAVTDESIRKTLENFLASKGGDKKIAFSAEGLAEMNRNIEKYTPNGKPHKPIWRARFKDKLGEKYQVGTSGNKSSKFVEAQAGTNLYFAVYRTPDGKREFATIPLRVVLANIRANMPPVPATNADGNALLFALSPGDVVYLPTASEAETGIADAESIDRNRLFKMVKTTQNRASFVPVFVSNSIKRKVEFGPDNCLQTFEGITIMSSCLPVKLDRLGNILKVGV